MKQYISGFITAVCLSFSFLMFTASQTQNLGDITVNSIRVVDNITFEFMLNSLRLKDGFDVELFETRTGQPFQVLTSRLDKAVDLDLIKIQKKWLKPTTKGFNFLNDLQEIFL